MSDNLRQCRRCLLSEIADKAASYQSVVQHIERIPERLRASQKMYEQRLRTCKTCSELNEGTCMQCGCYVEMRAATKNIHCPMRCW